MADVKRSPWLLHYDAASCNGCDIEVLAALTPVYDAERLGVVNTGDPMQADILLMEVSRLPAYTLENRLKLIACVRKVMPNCKFVLLCDENVDPELAHRVMIVRQDRLIDAFLYASVTHAYLTAALDAL